MDATDRRCLPVHRVHCYAKDPVLGQVEGWASMAGRVPTDRLPILKIRKPMGRLDRDGLPIIEEKKSAFSWLFRSRTNASASVTAAAVDATPDAAVDATPDASAAGDDHEGGTTVAAAGGKL